MAIALDKANLGTVQSSASSSTIAVTTSQAVVAGGFVVFFWGWADKTVTLNSVSGGSLTHTIAVQRQWNVSGGVFNACGISYAQAPAGLVSTTAVTATLSGAVTGRCGGGSSFTGVDSGGSPTDTTATSQQASATAWTSGSIAIQAGSVLVTCAWAEGGDSSTPSSGTEAFEVFSAADDYGFAAHYQIQASAGSYTNSGTFGLSSNQVLSSAAFLAAAGGGGSTDLPHLVMPPPIPA